MIDCCKHKTLIQLVKYGVIGLSNTIITLAVFYVLNTLCGFPYGVSNVTGYILGVINSFIWNRTWVFKSHGKMTHQMMLFIVGFWLCLGLQLIVSWILLEPCNMKNLEISWLPMKNSGQNVVMVLAMVVYTVANYIYNRTVTFKEKARIEMEEENHEESEN